MSQFSDCVGETVSAFIPDDLSWWLLAVIIACLITAGVAGAFTLASGAAVVITACLAAIGITIAGPALLGLAVGLVACARHLLP